MIIDFHTHVLSPEDQDKYTTSKFHQTVLASRDFGRRHPATIDNVLEAAKIGGIDVSVISNPLHDMRDMDRGQQLETVRRHNRYMAHLQQKHDSIYAFASTVPCGVRTFLGPATLARGRPADSPPSPLSHARAGARAGYPLPLIQGDAVCPAGS